MKYEMFLIRGLFAACLLVSGLILGTMLFSTGLSIPAGTGTAGVASITAATGCAVPPDGVMCVKVRS
jgi:hypothetical protein